MAKIFFICNFYIPEMVGTCQYTLHSLLAKLEILTICNLSPGQIRFDSVSGESEGSVDEETNEKSKEFMDKLYSLNDLCKGTREMLSSVCKPGTLGRFLQEQAIHLLLYRYYAGRVLSKSSTRQFTSFLIGANIAPHIANLFYLGVWSTGSQGEISVSHPSTLSTIFTPTMSGRE